MRRSRLRRWLLRGALVAAAAVGPTIMAESASAEWSWGEQPCPATTAPAEVATPGSDSTVSTESQEWQWG